MGSRYFSPRDTGQERRSYVRSLLHRSDRTKLIPPSLGRRCVRREPGYRDGRLLVGNHDAALSSTATTQHAGNGKPPGPDAIEVSRRVTTMVNVPPSPPKSSTRRHVQPLQGVDGVAGRRPFTATSSRR